MKPPVVNRKATISLLSPGVSTPVGLALSITINSIVIRFLKQKDKLDSWFSFAWAAWIRYSSIVASFELDHLSRTQLFTIQIFPSRAIHNSGIKWPLLKTCHRSVKISWHTCQIKISKVVCSHVSRRPRLSCYCLQMVCYCCVHPNNTNQWTMRQVDHIHCFQHLIGPGTDLWATDALQGLNGLTLFEWFCYFCRNLLGPTLHYRSSISQHFSCRSKFFTFVHCNSLTYENLTWYQS